MDITKITLGELLSSNNETIKRNAISIMKELQKQKVKYEFCPNNPSHDESHICLECAKIPLE